jgi:hypothetical protein
MKPRGKDLTLESSKQGLARGTKTTGKHTSLTQTPQHIARAQIDVVRETKDFHKHFSAKTKEKMTCMERSINRKNQKLSKD